MLRNKLKSQQKNNCNMIKIVISTKNGTTVSLDIPDTEDVSVTNSRIKQVSAVVYPPSEDTQVETPSTEQCDHVAPSGKTFKSVGEMLVAHGLDEIAERINSIGEKVEDGEVGGEEGGCKGDEGEVEGEEEEKPERIYDLDHTIDTALDKFQFPCQQGIYTPPMALTRDFVLAFGEAHVTREFLKARSWLIANSQKRKTQRGMGRYLNSWLCREAGMKRTAVKEVAKTKTGSLLDDGITDSTGW